MNTWNRFPFVRFAIAGMAGILLYEYFPAWWANHWDFVIYSVSFFLITWLLAIPFKVGRAHFLSGIAALILIAYLFGWVSSKNRPLDNRLHWRHINERIQAFEGRVVSDVTEKSTTRRYTIELSEVRTTTRTQQVVGQLHLYVKKIGRPVYLQPDLVLKYGDVIHVLASPTEIPPPTNPEEFNYSAYMERQHVHGQCFIEESRIQVFMNDPASKTLAVAFQIREYLRDKIVRYIPQEEEQAIALALLIGVKDYLSEDLKRAYSSAGAMHVLAVSGLHVGILYLIILGFLRPLQKVKRGKIVIAVITISIIWLYTFITGMSPSVLRAAVMFSVFATSSAMDRDNNIYNSLGIAAFILLLWEPNLLFSVGFQLSFLALTGIVYLQPKIYHRLYVSNPFLNKVWEITAVSVAAQISTLPLTIYYFHQFPTYFFLSNLVVIPGAMVIMVFGIFTLVIGTIHDFTGFVFGFFLSGIIELMNFLVGLVEQIPGSLITWLYFDDLQVTLVYAFLVILLLGFYHKSLSYFTTAALIICTVFGWSAALRWSQLQDQELVIYDISGATAIDLIKGETASLFVESKDKSNHELLKFQIDPYRRRKRLNPYHENLQEFNLVAITNGALKYGDLANHRILILDSLLTGLSIEKPLEADILIINNQSVKSIDWLQRNFAFKTLVIGSDNSTYYSEWIQKELKAKKIRAHSLLIDGSYRKKIPRKKRKT